MTDKNFGTRKPAKFWQILISCCHRPELIFLSKLIAPVLRRVILYKSDFLPIDIRASGINMRCYFKDNYSEKKFVFTPWRFDKKERNIIRKNLSEGEVFIDIGANVGIYTLTASQVLEGKNGKIIAFEPNPKAMERLKINIEANSCMTSDKVVLMNIGIADKDTSFKLYLDKYNLGASTIRNYNSDDEVVEIQCRPLISVLKDLDINFISILKIDIEGAEDIALVPFIRNAPERLLPKIIIIENSGEKWSCDLYEIFKYHGYNRDYCGPMNSVFFRNSAFKNDS